MTVVTGPKIPISAPPSGGPTMVAVQVVDSNRRWALSRCSRATRPFRHAPLTARKQMSAAPTTTATTSSCPNRTDPTAYAAGRTVTPDDCSRYRLPPARTVIVADFTTSSSDHQVAYHLFDNRFARLLQLPDGKELRQTISRLSGRARSDP
jgi:hypothetical protein